MKVREKAPRFENGHNESLRNVMIRMRDFEFAIREFVDGLAPKPESEFLKDRSLQFRNKEKLEEILEITEKYEKILSHLVEHSDHMMMSPRIQSIPKEKQTQFMAMYKQAYVNYLEAFQKLKLELESYKDLEPSQWNNKNAQSILMDMHTQMGAAHNRF